ncbi:hypothetical protein [Mucilaginibacter sp.]|jgi:hypothetical protein|uniref:hypothetical protein n=1 Tax=Mucilaginibacter sp. TaxID=1882438 RepID=UPI002C98CCE5|nr:hypothetical protein [Mucilaginibacter sp.]HTI60049.1 hypothetical protein [Mucilaginibacter sp.]
MEGKKIEFWKANNPVSLFIYYIAGFLILVAAHHIYPTQGTQIGLDIPAFFVCFILCLFLFIKTLLRVSKLKRPLTKPMVVNVFLSYVVNFTGAALLVFLFMSPSNSW